MATHEISRQNGDIEPKTSTMATPLPDPIVYNPTLHTHFLHQVAAIHASCILVDHTMATFLPPLSHAKILASWETWSSQVEAGQRVILLQLARTGDGEETVAGAVSLYCPETETGSHRGEVGRLLVSPDFRYRGIARKLMEALEKVAVERGRWLIVSRYPKKINYHVKVD